MKSFSVHMQIFGEPKLMRRIDNGNIGKGKQQIPRI